MLSFGLLTLSFGLIACKEDASAGAKETKIIGAGVLPGAAQSIAIGIARIEAKQGGSVDISQLDFSWPGELGYNEDPHFNIYSPEGGQIIPISDPRVLSYWNDYTEYPRFIVTLGNRVKNVGTEKSELMAILPKATEIACKVTIAFAEENKIPSKDVVIPKTERINITPHPQEVLEEEIVALPSKYGCVETPDGFFYYHLLVER